NQLNFSGRKHTREKLEEFVSNPLLDKYVLKCSDRYGSYGTVGFSLVDYALDTLRVQEFMLSCRVQGKLIEKAFFQHLFQHHRNGATRLWVNFCQSTRNQLSRQVLDSLGFHANTVSTDSLGQGMVSKSPENLQCDMIEVRCQACLDHRIPSELRGIPQPQ